MGQCRTLDVTVGCYYGDCSSCDNTIPTSLFIWNKFFSLTLLRFVIFINGNFDICRASPS